MCTGPSLTVLALKAFQIGLYTHLHVAAQGGIEFPISGPLLYMYTSTDSALLKAKLNMCNLWPKPCKVVYLNNRDDLQGLPHSYSCIYICTWKPKQLLH